MNKFIIFLFLLPLAIISFGASANAGLPMIMLAVPVYSISLLPIIAIEAIYLQKSLDLTKGLSIKTAFVSNLVSTIVGVPLTWVILVLIQMLTGGGGAYGVDTFVGKMLAVTWQAPWLIPYESDLHWMILFAGLFLIIPFYFVSWWSEFLVSKKMLADTGLSKYDIKLKVRNANLITYSLLACWPIGWYVVGYVLKQPTIFESLKLINHFYIQKQQILTEQLNTHFDYVITNDIQRLAYLNQIVPLSNLSLQGIYVAFVVTNSLLQKPVILNELKAITVTGSEKIVFIFLGSRTRKAFQIQVCKKFTDVQL